MQIDLGTGLFWFVSFLFSTTVHEAMHALVAWRLGDPTAYNGGQVSLSPVPHVQSSRSECSCCPSLRPSPRRVLLVAGLLAAHSHSRTSVLTVVWTAAHYAAPRSLRIRASHGCAIVSRQ